MWPQTTETLKASVCFAAVSCRPDLASLFLEEQGPEMCFEDEGCPSCLVALPFAWISRWDDDES